MDDNIGDPKAWDDHMQEKIKEHEEKEKKRKRRSNNKDNNFGDFDWERYRANNDLPEPSILKQLNF